MSIVINIEIKALMNRGICSCIYEYQSVYAAKTYKPAAAIWKMRVVLYTNAKPIASNEYRMPVISPFAINCSNILISIFYLAKIRNNNET